MRASPGSKPKRNVAKDKCSDPRLREKRLLQHTRRARSQQRTRRALLHNRAVLAAAAVLEHRGKRRKNQPGRPSHPTRDGRERLGFVLVVLIGFLQLRERQHRRTGLLVVAGAEALQTFPALLVLVLRGVQRLAREFLHGSVDALEVVARMIAGVLDGVLVALGPELRLELVALPLLLVQPSCS